MTVYNPLEKFCIGLCDSIRSFIYQAIAFFFLFSLALSSHAVPFTISATTPSEAELQAAGISDLEATDFCVEAAGDGFNSSVFDFYGDYELAGSSQSLSRVSFGHQQEAYGGLNTSFSNLGNCVEFTNDPLGPSEPFSVTFDATFLDDSLSDVELLSSHGLNTGPAGAPGSCLFSYHEDRGALEPEIVHYLPGACDVALAVSPVSPKPPLLLVRDDAIRQAFVIPEPRTLVLFIMAGLLVRLRKAGASRKGRLES